MTCLACGFDNPADARFCGRCGAALGLACPSCGATVRPELAYCTSCGTQLATREERKVLTVLFADLVGFTGRAEQLDPEEVRRVLTPYYARLRSELERFGGTVEKFIGDAVVALFGAPVAHEDDAERGARAALAIREAVAELNEAEPGLDLHVRIAVTTGEAVVALGARPTEGEGMAAGDVLNTASYGTVGQSDFNPGAVQMPRVTPSDWAAYRDRAELVRLQDRTGIDLRGSDGVENIRVEPRGLDKPVLVSDTSSFNWGDAGIGAGLAFAAMLLAGAAALSVRQHGRLGQV